MLRLALRLIASLALLALATLALAQQPAKKPPLSPRRTVEFAFADGKKITVDYGAPSMRGRKIMGALVPYGKIWRTGANEATGFVTEADLLIAGTPVPAGKYTLYTMPGENDWKLLINKQTGQWGTVYDQSQDLARVDLKKETIAQPVEQFTISFDKAGAQNTIMRLQWENTDLSVEIQEKK